MEAALLVEGGETQVPRRFSMSSGSYGVPRSSWRVRSGDYAS